MYAIGFLESSNDACHTLIFLYALTQGKCSKSFGLNVARLAGVQKPIIDKAHLTADSFLEKAEYQR
jgi:DNA mismatch repair ATPase MutS